MERKKVVSLSLTIDMRSDGGFSLWPDSAARTGLLGL